MADTNVTWPVAVFAHNEATRIKACLDSVLNQSSDVPLQVYVLVNGCTDATEAVVDEYARRVKNVVRLSLALGDKVNAWNVFVHELCPDAEVAFFVDGDVEICTGAFRALASTLKAHSEANAAAGVPSTGRGREHMTRLVMDKHLILGNLYALRGSLIHEMREARCRMPVGYMGDDGLLTSLVKWNLRPDADFHDSRVAGSPQAQFAFRSLSPFRIGDWRVYVDKQIRYSLRYFQHELLRERLVAKGLDGMPSSVDGLYRGAGDLSLRPRPGSTLIFDFLALRRLRKRARTAQATGDI